MAFSAFGSSSKGWGDCASDDELEVPRRALGFAPKPAASAVAPACSRPVRADDLRQLAEESQDGINLAFKQALTIADGDATSPSMASALQAAMTRLPRGKAALPTRSRKRTATGRPVGEASPQKPQSPLPAWGARSHAGPSFAAALAGRAADTASSSASTSTPTTAAAAAAAAPSTPLSASASFGCAATPQTARSSPPSLARALSYASAASRETLPVQSLGKRMKRALLDDAGDTDAPRARSSSDTAADAEEGVAAHGPAVSAVQSGEQEESEEGASESGSARRAERPAPEPLTEDRVCKRSRQIDLGKATAGYRRYAAEVPREARIAGSEFHPSTPNARAGESKRQWMGRARQWRRQLHLWDEGVPAGAPDLQLPAPALGSAASSGSASRRRPRVPKRAASKAGRRSGASVGNRADLA